MLKDKTTQARFITTCTAYNKEYLLRLLNGHRDDKTERHQWMDKIIVNYHGVDFTKFKVDNTDLDGKLFTILSVGTLNRAKGFEYLIDACRIIKDKGINFRCIIAGGGYLEAKLKEMVKSQGLTKEIHFTGYIPQEELIPYYKMANLFVLAAVLEIHWGIPNVLFEALAAKVPIMCTGLPAVTAELIDNMQTGIIIPNKDSQGIADKIEIVYKDKELRNRLIKNGYERVKERFDILKNVKELVEIFNKHIEK
jgi:glycosyltransferase involved in cell wall biosynthesis